MSAAKIVEGSSSILHIARSIPIQASTIATLHVDRQLFQNMVGYSPSAPPSEPQPTPTQKIDVVQSQQNISIAPKQLEPLTMERQLRNYNVTPSTSPHRFVLSSSFTGKTVGKNSVSSVLNSANVVSKSESIPPLYILLKQHLDKSRSNNNGKGKRHIY